MNPSTSPCGMSPQPVGPRSIATIARAMRAEWGAKVNYAAKPYLDAMLSLDTPADNYGADSAQSIVVYFLSNANSFRGEKAKALKAELKALFPAIYK